LKAKTLEMKSVLEFDWLSTWFSLEVQSFGHFDVSVIMFELWHNTNVFIKKNR